MRVSGVVNVDRINELHAAAHQSQAPGLGPRQDAPDELRITGTPDQVGTQCHRGELRSVGLDHHAFGLSLGGRIGGLEMRGKGCAFIHAFDVAAPVDHRRGAGVDKALDAMPAAGLYDIGRANNIGLVIVRVGAPDTGLGTDMEDGVAVLCRRKNGLHIRQIRLHDFHSQVPQRGHVAPLQGAH